jgi:solute carrier family 25 oxoglutarate transporter 11
MSVSKKVEPFVCGGTAAMFASSVIHPIDLAKVRLQLLPAGPKPSFLSVLGGMASKNGITSCYAGLSASLMRQAIYGTARIGLHRSFSDALVERNGGKPINFVTKALSGMASGSIAVCIGTPFDVALVRMQSGSYNYTNVFNALSRISSEEGVSTLYSGLMPNILRGMSMNVGMLACYDQAKEMVASYVTKDDASNPNINTRLISSAIAGFTAASFSLPFDLLKSRMQADPSRYSGVLNAASSVLRKEGVLTFWTGFGAYYGRCAPHSMIILISSESITKAYRTAFSPTPTLTA